MNKSIVLASVAFLAFLVGCKTQTPYDCIVEKDDAVKIEDAYAQPELPAKLKVAVRPAKKNAGKQNIDDQVCARVKDLLASSDYFDIAVRDDLENIKVEDLNSGGAETDFSLIPSELLILVNANVTAYLGGTTPGKIERTKAAREDAVRKGDMQCVMLLDRQLAKMTTTAVDDPLQAFGVTVNSSCSAYNRATLKQYVSHTYSKNHVAGVVGRTDLAIAMAAKEIAAQFVSRLTNRLSPAMKIDCLITETRGNGEFVKVDISALAPSNRPAVGGRAIVYTHEKGRKGATRKEIASGDVWAVEAESVWVKITEKRGYGQPHIGHCADFK